MGEVPFGPCMGYWSEEGHQEERLRKRRRAEEAGRGQVAVMTSAEKEKRSHGRTSRRE